MFEASLEVDRNRKKRLQSGEAEEASKKPAGEPDEQYGLAFGGYVRLSRQMKHIHVQSIINQIQCEPLEASRRPARARSTGGQELQQLESRFQGLVAAHMVRVWADENGRAREH